MSDISPELKLLNLSSAWDGFDIETSNIPEIKPEEHMALAFLAVNLGKVLTETEFDIDRVGGFQNYVRELCPFLTYVARSISETLDDTAHVEPILTLSVDLEYSEGNRGHTLAEIYPANYRESIANAAILDANYSNGVTLSFAANRHETVQDFANDVVYRMMQKRPELEGITAHRFEEMVKEAKATIAEREQQREASSTNTSWADREAGRSSDTEQVER